MRNKLKKKDLLIPCCEIEQKRWFKLAGLKMPKEIWLRKVSLFGIAHISQNLAWDSKTTIKKWWTDAEKSAQQGR
jgi:hypothetical protein